MLRIAIIAATLGSEVAVPLTQTDGAGGVQVDIIYDSNAVTFLGFSPTTETIAYFREQLDPVEGSYRVLFSSTAALPELLGHANFLINGLSELRLENAVLGTPLGESIDQTGANAPQNGRIEVVNAMQLQFTVPEFLPGTPTPASADGTRIYESDNADPALGTVVALVDIPAPGLVGTAEVASNRGNRWYFARYFNEGGPGPSGSVVVFDTNVPPTEAPGQLTIAIV